MSQQNMMHNPYPANPYSMQQNGLNMQQNGMNMQQNGMNMQQNGMNMQQNDYSQSIFHNPLDPEMNQNMPNGNNSYFANSYMNPYPSQSFIPKQPSGMKSIMNSFKTQDGSIDFTKMMNTAGQMMGAFNQVSSLVKGLGGIIKV
ncbi:hypothetical protein F7731_01585 [Cytobacillus depressus]|uniref:Spore coat protein n=2 Tax=Cytobacillus depressus TaxID=1602942 RepID=A0A6L3VDH0_9BACI|nr:hypothetical protein F7731_01585 [Cytobacillus depressus]